MYDYTLDLARYQPLLPERAMLLRSLQDDEVNRNRFFGVLAGSVRIQDFYSR